MMSEAKVNRLFYPRPVDPLLGGTLVHSEAFPEVLCPNRWDGGLSGLNTLSTRYTACQRSFTEEFSCHAIVTQHYVVYRWTSLDPRLHIYFTLEPKMLVDCLPCAQQQRSAKNSIKASID